MTSIVMMNEKSATVEIDCRQITVTADEWTHVSDATPSIRDGEVLRIAQYKYNFELDA